jgi:hypothetical protein
MLRESLRFEDQARGYRPSPLARTFSSRSILVWAPAARAENHGRYHDAIHLAQGVRQPTNRLQSQRVNGCTGENSARPVPRRTRCSRGQRDGQAAMRNMGRYLPAPTMDTSDRAPFTKRSLRLPRPGFEPIWVLCVASVDGRRVSGWWQG